MKDFDITKEEEERDAPLYLKGVEKGISMAHETATSSLELVLRGISADQLVLKLLESLETMWSDVRKARQEEEG